MDESKYINWIKNQLVFIIERAIYHGLNKGSLIKSGSCVLMLAG